MNNSNSHFQVSLLSGCWYWVFNSVSDCVSCSIPGIISCVGFQAHESVIIDVIWCELLRRWKKLLQLLQMFILSSASTWWNSLSLVAAARKCGGWKEARRLLSAIDTHANSRRGKIRVNSTQRKKISFFCTIKPTRKPGFYSFVSPRLLHSHLFHWFKSFSCEIKVTAQPKLFVVFAFLRRQKILISLRKTAQNNLDIS